jgi:hypothetical protein
MPSHPAWATKACFELPLSTKLGSIIGQAGAVSIVISQPVAIKAPPTDGAEDITKPKCEDNLGQRS